MIGGGWISKLNGLLAPPGITCLACGKRSRAVHRRYPELCEACYHAIPWIREPRCKVCGRAIGCPDCSRPGAAQHRAFTLSRSAVMYSPVMREWLAQYKYRGRESLAPLLARMTGEAYGLLAEEMYTWGGQGRRRSSWSADAVTFVPVSPSRLLERGFNQAEAMAAEVALRAKAPLCALLERTRDTEKQSMKSRGERLLNMKAAFRASADAEGMMRALLVQSRYLSRQRDPLSVPSMPAPLRIVLVDDIYTTGSTASACSAVLQQLGEKACCSIEVYSITWARS